MANLHGLIEVPLNPTDLLHVPQPAAAGVAAAGVAEAAAGSAEQGLPGLQDQVKKFYDIYNKAEGTRRDIEKFLFGTSCTTAGFSVDACQFMCLTPHRITANFI
jgi:hypothetical protein